jgi:hypothetical protein
MGLEGCCRRCWRLAASKVQLSRLAFDLIKRREVAQAFFGDFAAVIGTVREAFLNANIHSTNYCTRLRSIIQSVSHVLPPSVDSACSQ